MTKNDLFTLAFTKILKRYIDINDEHNIPDIVKDQLIAMEIIEMNWRHTHRKNT